MRVTGTVVNFRLINEHIDNFFKSIYNGTRSYLLFGSGFMNMRWGLLSYIYAVVLSVLCSFAGVVASSDVVEIGTLEELRYRLSISCGDCLSAVLTNDIFIDKNSNLVIESDLNLNLNGYGIVFKSPDAQILIGKKIERKFSYEVVHPAHWEQKTRWVNRYDDSLKCWRSVPEHYSEWVREIRELKYRTEYEYCDDISIGIENGNIRGTNGYDAKDKEDAYWFSEACGGDGSTPLPLFKVISGRLNFLNCQIRTGNGGNGGNATYAALWHFPIFGGGDGGNGGNGGNGGSLCCIDKGQVLVSGSKFVAGHGGKGGKGSKANPNYWLIPGDDGEDGKFGHDGDYLVGSSKGNNLRVE